MRALILILPALVLTGCERAPMVIFADNSITLPDDPLDLPPGAGVDAVIANCTACHSPSTMLQQPRLSREQWLATVTKMREVYKAPINEPDIPLIVDYLAAVQQGNEGQAER